ncbi:MAG TPA: hypothetical protein VLT47_02040 [Anaeromyxobacteraceae bacterium]|nr:hypothetical protein [Anaeromyxobacteraceae bacterium]
MRTPVALAPLALGLLVSGCTQEHLSSGFGRAQRAAFQAQAVRPAEKARPPTMALDTQEADVVARSYVRSLAGREDRSEPEPILLVAPQRQGQPAAKPAPSVPRE